MDNPHCGQTRHLKPRSNVRSKRENIVRWLALVLAGVGLVLVAGGCSTSATSRPTADQMLQSLETSNKVTQNSKYVASYRALGSASTTVYAQAPPVFALRVKGPGSFTQVMVANRGKTTSCANYGSGTKCVTTTASNVSMAIQSPQGTYGIMAMMRELIGRGVPVTVSYRNFAGLSATCFTAKGKVNTNTDCFTQSGILAMETGTSSQLSGSELTSYSPNVTPSDLTP